MSFRIDPEIEDEIRNAVLTLSGPPLFLNLSRFMEDAARKELDFLRRTHNQGKPWPKWKRAVKRGRPIKENR